MPRIWLVVLLASCGRIGFDPFAGASTGDGAPGSGDGRAPGDPIAQVHYLKASNAAAGDNFGTAVALSADGTTLAIGASGEDSSATGIGGDQTSNAATDSGAAYVFVHSGDTWVQQAYIKASNTDAGDQFGQLLAISADGNTLAVAAPSESSGKPDDQADNAEQAAGAVYVFTRAGATWSEQAYLKAPAPDVDDFFGDGIAISGDGHTLVVGSTGEDSAAQTINGNQNDNSANDAGAAYVFVGGGSAWAAPVYLKAANADANDDFGQGVAVSRDGTTVLVGSQGESSAFGALPTDNSKSFAGAVYEYKLIASTWKQTAMLKADNADAEDAFGFAVAVSDDASVIAAGANPEASSATGIGGNEADNTASGAGAVYLFDSATQYVKASNTQMGAYFGDALAVSGDGNTLIVTAPREASGSRGIDGDQANQSAPASGAAYLFRRAPQWAQTHYVKASNADAGDQLGAVAVDEAGATIVIGAPHEASAASGVDGDQADNSAPSAGAVYVFR